MKHTPLPTSMSGNDFCYALAADRFSQGFVTSISREITNCMFAITESLVHSGEDLTDEICASAALSLFAEVEIPSKQLQRFRRCKHKTTIGVLVRG